MKTFLRLLGSELERFTARRMARVLLIIAVGIGVLVGTITFLVTDDHSAPDSAAVQECYEDLEQWGLEESEKQEACFDWEDDRFHLTWLLGESTEDWSETRPTPEPNRTEPFRGLEGILPAIGGLLAILTGGLVGASFFGAEYRFGTIEQVLLWEPRRNRVLLAKYLTTFIGSALVATTGSLAIAFSLWPTALAKGTTQGVDARFWIDLISTAGRIGIAAGLLGIISGTVAIFTRHTAGAVMSLLGYQLIGGIIINVWIKWLAPWDPLFNATAFLSESDTTKWVKQREFGLTYWTEVSANSYLTAGLIAFAIASVFALGGFIVFNRRDVS